MIENGNLDEKKNVRKKLLMTIALVIITIVIGVGGVYAYFAAAVSQDTTSQVSVNAVSGLAISFSHGAEINIGNVLPGQSWTKTFSAKLINNSTDIEVSYDILLHINNNNFDPSRGYLEYSLTGPNVNVSNVQITRQTSGDVPLVENKSIKGNKETNNVTDSYTLTISYPNNETSVQEQGGVFSGYIKFTPSNNQIKYEEKGSSSGIIYPAGKTKETVAVGDLIQIGTEGFYVISNDNGSIAALAKYNLLLGSTCDKDGNNCQTIDKTTTEGYGLQNETAKGWDNPNQRIGTTAYGANNQYTGSIVEGYVNTYVNNVLKPIAGEEITGRLITKEELNSFGCSDFNYCPSNKNWLYQTSYWSGSTYSGNGVWQVRSDRSFSWIYYYTSNVYGVRPVINF